MVTCPIMVPGSSTRSESGTDRSSKGETVKYLKQGDLEHGELDFVQSSRSVCSEPHEDGVVIHAGFYVSIGPFQTEEELKTYLARL